MVCSDARQAKFPFDVQHRSIIRYSTGSPRDFEKLSKSITERMTALLAKEQTLSAATEISMLQKIHGLEQHEVVTLAALGENIHSIEEAASGRAIRQDMERAGFTNFATTIALKSLSDRGLVTSTKIQDQDGYEYTGYLLTKNGWAWILENKSEFVLKKPPRRGRTSPPDADDIPF